VNALYTAYKTEVNRHLGENALRPVHMASCRRHQVMLVDT